MSNVDLTAKIPNNVDLAGDKRLLRALEQWQPNYIDWWKEMGPEGFQEKDVWLRTAISVDAEGWAHFDYVKMPDYRWGIFLADPVADRKIGFGDVMGDDAWQVVPGEHRNTLRRLIVTQGDTEPASVEQQRLLGTSAPSLYDLRNLFQVNVEEGRHLWAMVYLLHSQFGRDGREEAEELLARRSGNPDKPRILGAFNAPIENWLDFFMFTMFTDRDGKYQLLALAESGFDPLARTTRFMLTEEAHHMFVGETGVERVVQRTVELMQQAPEQDVTKLGGVPLSLVQKHLNLWFSLSLDLFGGEISSNAATFYSNGLKGRFDETKIDDDHALHGSEYPVMDVVADRIVTRHAPALQTLNERLRDDWIADVAAAVGRWNRVPERHGIPFRFTLPHKAFHRRIGVFAEYHVSPDGQLMSEADWTHRHAQWIPSEEDRAFVHSLMGRVAEPGKFANWIAPPAVGINKQPVDFEYVRFA